MNAIYYPARIEGYSEGMIKANFNPTVERTDRGDLPKGNNQNINHWFTIGDTRYNVHGYRPDLHGYPVRWRETVQR